MIKRAWVKEGPDEILTLGKMHFARVAKDGGAIWGSGQYGEFASVDAAKKRVEAAADEFVALLEA